MAWYLPDWLTGYDAENAARAAAADAELRRIAAERIESGYYTPEQVSQVERNYRSDAYLNDVEAHDQVTQAFDEGWQQGSQNVSGFIKGTLNKIIADPLRAVIGGLPWWVWLVAGGVVFGYLGGFAWLKKKLQFN